MSFLELIVLGLALFMVLPAQLEKAKALALATPIYILLGVALGFLLGPAAKSAIAPVAGLGFILLLFTVGLEIRLPRWSDFAPALAAAAGIYLAGFAVVAWLALLSGLTVGEALLAAAALSGVSIGLAHSALKEYFEKHPRFLQIFVALELITIAIFSLAGPLIKAGLSWWLPVKILAVLAFILILSRLAQQAGNLFGATLNRITHHRAHFLVFAIFLVAVIGERLGLSAAKTAFFLALFMAYADGFGALAQQSLHAIGERFLIPLFILWLGIQIRWETLTVELLAYAVLSAAVLLGLRYLMFHKLLHAPEAVARCSCVNLTMAAIAIELAGPLLEASPAPSWILLVSLITTLAGMLSARGRATVAASA